ncbi:hypothetical protein [Alkalihalophilus marmarensis]|jgi:hypothetical protein|uniref:hypothetical protein n=1 Tax=Alkalihalophilus marmarensis TaxID=521377 RepID=UPI0003F8406E|nr:hypothetical protein [Alkalihalophilus marmarensis]MCM3489057.1 hypothetical protein [Alkalihalophilus marmarensis]MED1603068.1 hypothetical protein [Alkalihalophilus marmarensis]
MKKTKSVAFNLSDPYEEQLLEHTKQFTNFSSYIKRLIQRDMEEGKAKIPVKKQVVRSENGGFKLDLS